MNILHDKFYWLKDLEFLPMPVYVKTYQEKARIYLDEYEVEEWDYLPLFDNSLIMQRFLDKK